jgi:cytochrome c-type biogenesis protein CcmH/NrfG/NAD-dependent SIR2 family protein deacetylase
VLREAKERSRGASLLIGAGVSKTAEIPLAPEIVEDIRKKYGCFVQDCSEHTYQAYMRCLNPDQRFQLLEGYIKRAKLNAAHLYLAELVRAGYFAHILTTNFDPLAVSALYLGGVLPFVYDVANMQTPLSGLFVAPAVVYLHGQFGAVINIHDPDDAEKVKPIVREMLKRAVETGPLVVVGYSGENDPVFEELRKYGAASGGPLAAYHHGLYWAAHEATPSPDLLAGLLSDQSRHAHFAGGQDADNFFIRLSGTLNLEGPPVIKKPFTYLRDALNKIQPFQAEAAKADMTTEARLWAEQAEKCLQNGEPCSKLDALRQDWAKQYVIKRSREAWLEQRVELVDGLLKEAQRENATEAVEFLANALYNRATTLASQIEEATAEQGPAIEGRLRESLQLYRRATEIRPDFYQAFNNWGSVLSCLAESQTGLEAAATFRDACAKYQRATEIKPDKHESFNGWGNALHSLAHRQTGQEAAATLRDACAKYQRATEIKPDYHVAFNNWGDALHCLAHRQTGQEAAATLRDACAKYQRATEIKPDYHKAFNNWGDALHQLAHRQTGLEAASTLRDACAKYQRATEIKPDYHEAFNNWGSALYCLARRQTEPEAASMLRDACAKHQRATEIKPDDHEAFNNWGDALHQLAHRQTGPEAVATFRDAFAKYQRATEIKPDYHEAFNNWGSALYCLAHCQTGPEAASTLRDARAKYQRATEIKPDNHEAFNGWGDALHRLARRQTGPEAVATFHDACAKYQRATEIKPDYHVALTNWGIALAGLAKLQPKLEAEDTIRGAMAKFERAIELKPDYYVALRCLACANALVGNNDKAFELLRDLKTKDPVQFEEARTDEDFTSVHGDSRWKELFGEPKAPAS